MTGLQILQRTRQVSPELVKAFSTVPVANVSDSMSRMTAGGSRLRPM
ncbi:MAG: RraA family protein, partial [Haliea sp.]